MKCQSYFPVYNSHYDLNIDANGGASPMYNGNATFRSGHRNNYEAPFSLPQGSHFAYKELLRQTMLSQEDTFKHQVQELHRLYRRQKELMGDVKCKDMHLNRLHIEGQSSNSTAAKIPERHGDKAFHDLPFFDSHSTLGSTCRDNVQASLSSLKEQKVFSLNGGALNDLDFAESKGKKIKGKLLDLELPAEVYIDSDEEESLQATPPTTLFSNKRAKVVDESDVKPSAVSRSLNSVLQGELPSSFSYSTNTYMADLNEPPAILDLEESGEDKMTKSNLEISEKTHNLFNNGNTTPDSAADKSAMTAIAQSGMAKSQVDLALSGRKPSYNLKQNLLVVQALPSFNSQLSTIRGTKISGRQKLLNKKVDASQWCYLNSRVTRSSKSTCSESKLIENSVMSAKNLDLITIDLNFVSVPNTESTPSSDLIFTGGEILKKSQRCKIIDINLPFDPTTDDEPCDLVTGGSKISGQINLDCCLNDHGLSPKSSSLHQTLSEIDIEAPFSPEVEERPPPRGDSEENQPEDGCDPLAELANVAAEAIVSISSEYGISGLQKYGVSNSGNLEWFAGLISSLSIGVDSDFETMNCKDNWSIDDYEAMTLELTEMKVEDYWCKSTVQISSESCSILLPCQTRRGTAKRSKRKDFRREVLPSLASLSRYEVTEDIQMIEGLMEAVGTPWQLSRTRRACRTGRKPRVAKQQTFVEVPELTAVLSWGKVNRRSRGRRSRTSPTVLSKWLEYVL